MQLWQAEMLKAKNLSVDPLWFAFADRLLAAHFFLCAAATKCSKTSHESAH